MKPETIATALTIEDRGTYLRAFAPQALDVIFAYCGDGLRVKSAMYEIGAFDDALKYCVQEETTQDGLSESGKRWQKALDEMRARKAAAGGAA